MPAECLYEVYFATSAKRFYFRNDNCGVTVRDDGLAWTFEGQQDQVNFANISEVHLQSGGDWRNTISICEVAFRDGYRLTVTNAGAAGTYDEAQAPAFRAFVEDLHTRLVAAGRDDIDFTAGYREFNYNVVMVCAVLLGLMGIGIPLVIFLWKGVSEAFWLLAGGIFLIWPLAKMVQKNAPRTYNPRSPPDELLS